MCNHTLCCACFEARCFQHRAMHRLRMPAMRASNAGLLRLSTAPASPLNVPVPVEPGRDLAPGQRDKIAARDSAIRREHLAPHGGADAETIRKRLIWRSKQRGWLEVDLLLGSWAQERAMSLTDDEVAQVERLLALETIDIFNVISGQAAPPQNVQGPVLDELKRYAQKLGRMDPAKYAELKDKLHNRR